MTCPKCKNMVSSDTKFCRKCGAQIVPTVVRFVGNTAIGCWRIIKIVVGFSLVLGGIPWLFTPGFLGGVLMILVGSGLIQEAVED